ncbi:MAG: hypothetical protein WBF46_04140 [Candidatus Acidiferrales bacterium]
MATTTAINQGFTFGFHGSAGKRSAGKAGDAPPPAELSRRE